MLLSWRIQAKRFHCCCGGRTKHKSVMIRLEVYEQTCNTEARDASATKRPIDPPLDVSSYSSYNLWCSSQSVCSFPVCSQKNYGWMGHLLTNADFTTQEQCITFTKQRTNTLSLIHWTIISFITLECRLCHSTHDKTYNDAGQSSEKMEDRTASCVIILKSAQSSHPPYIWS